LVHTRYSAVPPQMQAQTGILPWRARETPDRRSRLRRTIRSTHAPRVSVAARTGGGADANRDPTVLIDIRTESQIARDGTIPGALVISRNVLEAAVEISCSGETEPSTS
jgi:hypothetical protein